MKKGIVLLITLGFIAVITALILWSLSITKERFDRVTDLHNQNQFNLLFADFSKMVQKFDINNSETLQVFLGFNFDTPIVESKSGLMPGFRLHSLMDHLNINAMLQTIVESENNSSKTEAANYYSRAIGKFLRHYELSDASLFESILLDRVDSDLLERVGESEIAKETLDVRQGPFYDFAEIKKIEDYYYRQTDDANIYKITQDEFEKYFYFGDPQYYGMFDCASMYAMDTMSLIVEDEMQLGEGVDICSESNTEAMHKLKKIYNISQYSSKSKYLVRCTVILNRTDSREETSFDYDVNSKRISNIDKRVW